MFPRKWTKFRFHYGRVPVFSRQGLASGAALVSAMNDVADAPVATICMNVTALEVSCLGNAAMLVLRWSNGQQDRLSLVCVHGSSQLWQKSVPCHKRTRWHNVKGTKVASGTKFSVITKIFATN